MLWCGTVEGVLCCVAVMWCGVLQGVLWCGTLLGVLWYGAMQGVWYGAVQGVLWCCALLGVLWYGAVLGCVSCTEVDCDCASHVVFGCGVLTGDGVGAASGVYSCVTLHGWIGSR